MRVPERGVLPVNGTPEDVRPGAKSLRAPAIQTVRSNAGNGDFLLDEETNCSIVIRAYNEARHLPRLLAESASRRRDVILGRSWLNRWHARHRRSVRRENLRIAPQESGLGRSLNLGLCATRELAVIASAHVYPVYPDWLERLLEPFQDASIARPTAKQARRETSKFSEHEIFARWFPDSVSNPRQPHPFWQQRQRCHPPFAVADLTLTMKPRPLKDPKMGQTAQSQGWGLRMWPKPKSSTSTVQLAPCAVRNRYRREAMAFKLDLPRSALQRV